MAEKRRSCLNPNATKQGRVWNMHISILAFSSFAQRKIKLGQNYQSAEKEFIHGYCFSSLCQFGHRLLHAHVCILACMCVRALCLVSGDKPSKSTCSVECTNTRAQCSHTLQSLSRQMLSSYTIAPNFSCSILGSVHLWSPPSIHLCGTAHACCCNWLLNNWPVWEAVGRGLLLEVNITAS